jgi:phosphoserine aminotransferase
MDVRIQNLIKKYLTCTIGTITPHLYEEHINWLNENGGLCFVSHKNNPMFQAKKDTVTSICDIFSIDQNEETVSELIKIIVEWFNENQNEINVDYNNITPYLLV